MRSRVQSSVVENFSWCQGAEAGESGQSLRRRECFAVAAGMPIQVGDDVEVAWPLKPSVGR